MKYVRVSHSKVWHLTGRFSTSEGVILKCNSGGSGVFRSYECQTTDDIEVTRRYKDHRGCRLCFGKEGVVV